MKVITFCLRNRDEFLLVGITSARSAEYCCRGVGFDEECMGTFDRIDGNAVDEDTRSGRI